MLGRHPHQERLKLNRALPCPCWSYVSQLSRGWKANRLRSWPSISTSTPSFWNHNVTQIQAHRQQQSSKTASWALRNTRATQKMASKRAYPDPIKGHGRPPELSQVLRISPAKLARAWRPGFFFPLQIPGQWKSLCLPVARHCSCGLARAFSAQGAQRWNLVPFSLNMFWMSHCLAWARHVLLILFERCFYRRPFCLWPVGHKPDRPQGKPQSNHICGPAVWIQHLERVNLLALLLVLAVVLLHIRQGWGCTCPTRQSLLRHPPLSAGFVGGSSFFMWFGVSLSLPLSASILLTLSGCLSLG